MDQIALEGMEFFAYHGHFDEEQKIGNKYSIDLYLDLDLKHAALSDNLKDTLDYGKIYEKVSLVMSKKHRLLEHVALQIIEKIRLDFQFVKKIRVEVSKFNPPIGGVCHRARVCIEEQL
jgi:dihydroneopterin aldolase